MLVALNKVQPISESKLVVNQNVILQRPFVLFKIKHFEGIDIAGAEENLDSETEWVVPRVIQVLELTDDKVGEVVQDPLASHQFQGLLVLEYLLVVLSVD